MIKVVALIVLTGVLVFGWVFINLDNLIEQAEEIEETEEVEYISVYAEEVDEEERKKVDASSQPPVSSMINDVHQVLNTITGFGSHTKYSDPNDEVWQGVASQLLAQATKVRETLEYAEGDVKKDLEDFYFVTKYAANHHDYNALLYSHRIIHDVDTMYNGKNKELFNASRLSSWSKSVQNSIEEIRKEAEKTE